METNIAQNEQKTSGFAKKRLEEAGVTAVNNRIRLTNPTEDFPKVGTIEHNIFTEDSEGNVQILYYTLDREPIIYEQKGGGVMAHINAEEKMYFQTRLKNPKGLDDLLNAFSSETEAIIEELTNENAPPQYFHSVLMENRLALVTVCYN